MSIRTRLATGAIAAASALALITATAPAAEAGTSRGGTGTLPSYCAGNYVGGKSNGGFRLDVFYSSSNGGTNCAILYNNTGVRVPMQLKIESFDYRDYALDTGNYVSYAGRVAIGGTARECIRIWAGATYGGRYYNLDTQGFCG